MAQPTLPCENGAGSLNNPNGDANQTGLINKALAPYVAPTLPVGTWQITGINPDLCAVNEQLNQAGYVAESLNISGAPINIYKLLGVHEQGNGSVLNQGKLITSPSYPGYPVTGINTMTGWRSLATGAQVTQTVAYVGVDFGYKKLTYDNQQSEYDPQAPKWTDVGAISITQSNVPGYWAQQVRVELADGKTCSGVAQYTGMGNGTLTVDEQGYNSKPGIVTATALTSTTFNCIVTLQDGNVVGLGSATIGTPFYSWFLNFTISAGTTPFSAGDVFSVQVSYIWHRAGVFNLIQSPSPQILAFETPLKTKAVRVVPTLFTGANSWEVDAFDVLDSPPPDINNIQDLFFNENRDRDYDVEPIMIKAQYTPADSTSDLSRFGLNILDQYVFTVSFATMVSLLGRPIVTGDILEVIPEMQYDQNLKPVRKFLEVTDTGWASSGFGPAYNPVVYRFNAQIALPSQETRDIFGTLDTNKYFTPDQVLMDGIASQVDTTPLTNTEEILHDAFDAVPETGSDDDRSVAGVVQRPAFPPANAKGQPLAKNAQRTQNLYIEAGLPPDGIPYKEGYALPDPTTAADGDYFRLNYPPALKLAPRLYRFSAVKNRFLYLETDRRGEYSSVKPSMQRILQSNNSRPLNEKQV